VLMEVISSVAVAVLAAADGTGVLVPVTAAASACEGSELAESMFWWANNPHPPTAPATAPAAMSTLMRSMLGAPGPLAPLLDRVVVGRLVLSGAIKSVLSLYHSKASRYIAFARLLPEFRRC